MGPFGSRSTYTTGIQNYRCVGPMGKCPVRFPSRCRCGLRFSCRTGLAIEFGPMRNAYSPISSRQLGLWETTASSLTTPLQFPKTPCIDHDGDSVSIGEDD